MFPIERLPLFFDNNIKHCYTNGSIATREGALGREDGMDGGTGGIPSSSGNDVITL
jgi:hypothetical protein